MSESSQNNKNNNKQQMNPNSELVKEGAKTAANAYAGPIGGKAVDLASKTKAGQAAMDEMANKLNNNKAAHAIQNRSKQTEKEEASKSEKALNQNNKQKSSHSFSNFFSKIQNNNVDLNGVEIEASTKIFNFIKRHWLKFLPILGYFCLALFVILLILIVVIAPLQMVADFFEGIWNTITGNKDWEVEYNTKLIEVQEELNKKYGVCIDINLITATLTVNKEFDDFLVEGQPLEGEGGSDTGIADEEYKKMIKQIELLGNMQIKRKAYVLDKTWSVKNPYTNEDIKFCTSPDQTDKVEELITSDNIHKINSSSDLATPVRSSATLREIASNDIQPGLFQWFTKKANEEKNYAYYLYRPTYQKVLYDENGNELDQPKIVCDTTLPSSEKRFAERDIGSISDMENHVYYWNLMDSFIGDYYSEYLPAGSGQPVEGTERYEKIHKIIENIYLLYEESGPSQTCKINYHTSINASCPNGITVVDNEVGGTYDLEEYVAGVVMDEMYSDFDIEALKALAVAARTYALHYTNMCTKSIVNSSAAQNFNPNYNDWAWEAASATAGEVLTYEGNIFRSEYDSWNCRGSNTCTYTKLPNRETHEVTISGKYLNRAAGGHGRGMSQIAAADMAASAANTGPDFYKTILQRFYSEGVQISVLGGSGSSLAVATGTKDEKLAYLFPDGLPTSETEMKNYLQTVSVTLNDINGNTRTGSLTVHKELADDVANIFAEIAESGFPINSVYCYSWRGMASNSSVLSHHSYGVACDINPKQNYMIKDGVIISGDYWKPGEDPYSIEENGSVVSTFAKYGWIWGGSWSSSKDYMHFSFTGY